MIARQEAGETSEACAIDYVAPTTHQVAESALLLLAEHDTPEIEQQRSRETRGRTAVGKLNNDDRCRGRCCSDIEGLSSSCTTSILVAAPASPSQPTRTVMAEGSPTAGSHSVSVYPGFDFDGSGGIADAPSLSQGFPRRDSRVRLALPSVPEWSCEIEDAAEGSHSSVGGEAAPWEETDDDDEKEYVERASDVPELDPDWENQYSSGCRTSTRSRTFSYDDGEDALIRMYIDMACANELSRGNVFNSDVEDD